MNVTYAGVDELSKKFKASAPLVISWKRQILNDSGRKVVAMAQGRVHVRSGHLRDSIESEVTNDSMQAYSDLEYAPYQEFGTFKLAPAPFLIPSLYQYVTTLPAAFLAFMKKVFW